MTTDVTGHRQSLKIEQLIPAIEAARDAVAASEVTLAAAENTVAEARRALDRNWQLLQKLMVLLERLPPQPDEESWTVADVVGMLEAFPLEKLIFEAAHVLAWPACRENSLRPDEATKHQLRQAVRASYAVGKIRNYLETLRSVDRQRGAITQELRRRFEEADASPDPIAARAALEPYSVDLSGTQEVLIHIYVICVVRITRLLPMAAGGSWVRLSEEQRSTLAEFEPLRHFFEHAEDHIKAPQFQGDVCREIESAEGWRMLIGFRLDSQGRVNIWDKKLNERTVDVTSSGVRRVEGVTEEVLTTIRDQRLGAVREALELSPDHIPPMGWIVPGSPVSVREPDSWGDPTARPTTSVPEPTLPIERRE